MSSDGAAGSPAAFVVWIGIAISIKAKMVINENIFDRDLFITVIPF
jgi:hypothetical protein